MKIGICGLGLIGGSMAMAYKNSDGADEHTVYGYDLSSETLEYAFKHGAIDGILDESTIGECELILIALYPRATENYLSQISSIINKNTIVMDLCGTKRSVCEKCFPLAESYGYTFVGGHPMAGKQYSGIKYARKELFVGAPMVIVPQNLNNEELINRVKEMLAPIGFGSYSVTTAAEHDKMIAFTSQLAHVVSNAYIKSPIAAEHKGFSAGSYKDLTRVAWLNEEMWSELFIENSDNLQAEIDHIIKALTEYRDALAAGDKSRLKALLRDGRIAKERVDG